MPVRFGSVWFGCIQGYWSCQNNVASGNGFSGMVDGPAAFRLPDASLKTLAQALSM
jgi:hypothetical protein